MACAELVDHVLACFAKARRKLKSAKDCLAADDWEDAVSRAYYAAYHAVEAALRVEGHVVRTHDGLKTVFGLRFVRAGLVPAHLGKALSRLKDERENGDYAAYTEFDRGDAERAIADARSIVDAMAAHIRSKGIEPEPPGGLA